MAKPLNTDPELPSEGHHAGVKKQGQHSLLAIGAAAPSCQDLSFRQQRPGQSFL